MRLGGDARTRQGRLQNMNLSSADKRPRDSWIYRACIRLYRLRKYLYFRLIGLRYRKKTEKYRAEFDESTGNLDKLPADFPKGVLYVYAIGVGEVQSALALISEVDRAEFATIVLAVHSVDGKAMAEYIASGCVDAVIYGPWDAPQFVKRTLERLCPKAYIVVELENKPTPVMLDELHRRKIPLFMVNASRPRAHAVDWEKPHFFWSGVLDCFEKIMLRSEEEKEKLLKLGLSGDKLIVTGNFKVDGLRVRRKGLDLSRWDVLKNGEGPVFLAGSIWPNEAQSVFEAFERLRERFPCARLVVAPRFLKDVGRVAEILRSRDSSLEAVLLSGLSGQSRWDVAIVDTIGVLFELYAVADAAFVGGSLDKRGGQNLMEPAVFGIPVTHGPHMADFPESLDMDGCGASKTVFDAEELSRAWLDPLDPAFRARTAAACGNYFRSVGGAAERSWEIIRDSLLKSGALKNTR